VTLLTSVPPTKRPSRRLNVVVIDNYDSFTFNLVQYLQELGADVRTIRNDACPAPDVLAGAPDFIVLSPGPSNPDEAGMCLELTTLADEANIPLLGVCLGHQTIGQVFGGRVVRAALPMHGKVSQISHQGEGVFAGLPSPIEATRYHSLVVERASLPKCLKITAWTADGTIMGLKHEKGLVEGVQFHPESILTPHGKQILANFACAAETHRTGKSG